MQPVHLHCSNAYLIHFIQQLQQQNLSLPQFVLLQPGHPIATPLQPAQFIISQPPPAQQGKKDAEECLITTKLTTTTYFK